MHDARRSRTRDASKGRSMSTPLLDRCAVLPRPDRERALPLAKSFDSPGEPGLRPATWGARRRGATYDARVTGAPLFRTFLEWTRETFGSPLHRVALDAGSQCPNRDGSKGYGGCVYCDVEGSGTGALRQGADLAEQLRAGLARVARRKTPGPAVAYFQSYSNTYVAPERLEEVLAVVEPHLGREVAAISVATRPDTLSEEALDVLERWNRRAPVWVELGLECADDARLIEINRLHTVADFLDAVARTKRRGLLTVGHAILGLPGDGREGARRTAEVLSGGVLSGTAVDGVKVHQLM